MGSWFFFLRKQAERPVVSLNGFKCRVKQNLGGFFALLLSIV